MQWVYDKQPIEIFIRTGCFGVSVFQPCVISQQEQLFPIGLQFPGCRACHVVPMGLGGLTKACEQIGQSGPWDFSNGDLY